MWHANVRAKSCCPSTLPFLRRQISYPACHFCQFLSPARSGMMLIAAREVSGATHGNDHHISPRVWGWSVAHLSALAEFGFRFYGAGTDRREEGAVACVGELRLVVRHCNHCGLRRSASGEPDIAQSRHPHRQYGSDVPRHHHRSGRACGYLRAGRPCCRCQAPVMRRLRRRPFAPGVRLRSQSANHLWHLA